MLVRTASRKGVSRARSDKVIVPPGFSTRAISAIAERVDTCMKVVTLHRGVSTSTGEEVILFTRVETPRFRESMKRNRTESADLHNDLVLSAIIHQRYSHCGLLLAIKKKARCNTAATVFYGDVIEGAAVPIVDLE